MAEALDEARRQPQRVAPRRAGRRARQRRPRPPRRLLHGQHGDAVASPRMATASATTTDCSARSSAAAGSRRRRKTGSPTAIRGNSSAPKCNYAIGFGGWVEMVQGEDERTRHIWHPAETVEAVGYDTPIVGWRGRHVNTLRLWSARAPDPLKLDAFNAGDYIGALSDRVRAEAISKVLYPSDATPAGQELRLRQEYFFASASLLDLIRRHVKQHQDVRTLGDHAAVQLNDTHPAIAIAELMRILVDLNGLDWDEAWAIAQATFSYTNHTLLPEALESWPVPLMERLLPRHMQIIYLINATHLDSARRRGFIDAGLLSSLSLIDEHAGRRVRMGNLAFVGSHKINGVSALHTDLMRKTVFHGLNAVYPGRIVNKTNGITFRRWLIECNPGLDRDHSLDASANARSTTPRLCRASRAYADDPSMQERVGRGASRRQGRAGASCRRTARPAHRSRCDVRRADQAHSRIQAPAAEHSRDDRALQLHPRQSDDRVRAAGEDLRRQGGGELHAGQTHHQARDRRRRVVNSDPTRARPAEGRVPAQLQRLPRRDDHARRRPLRADLDRGHGGVGHRQHEDGAQRRADDRHARRRQCRAARARRRRQHLHLRPDRAEVEAARAKGIDATARIAASPVLREALDEIASGVFSTDDADRYRGLVDALTHHDYFMVCADFDAYWAAQMQVDQAWRDRKRWMRSSILNTANVGWFSSDRTIAEYAKEIWNAPFAPIAERSAGRPKLGEDWRARDEDVDAIAAARQRRSFRGARPAPDAGRLGHPRLRARRDSRAGADPRGQAARRAAAPEGRLLRGADPVGQGAAGLSARGRDRARRVVLHRQLRLRPGARADRRLSAARGHASPALPPARRSAHAPRRRRRRAVRALGAQRHARLGRRRLQSLGRPALPDAQALRQRPVGDFRPRICGRSGLQIRARRPRRRAACR